MKQTLLILTTLGIATLADAQNATPSNNAVATKKWMITEDMIEGTWIGAWDGSWPVYYTISKRAKPAEGESKFVSTYHWVESSGDGFQHGDNPSPVSIVNGEVLLGNAFLEPVPDQPGVLLATGLWRSVRMTALYKAKPEDLQTSETEWRPLLEKHREGRRPVSRNESTAPLLLLDFSSRLQTPEERSKSGIDGVYVDQIDPGGSAEKAGMKVGDIVIKVNKQPLLRPKEIVFNLRNEKGEHPIPVTVWREKAEMDMQVIAKPRRGGPQKD
jgi:PDZ domain